MTGRTRVAAMRDAAEGRYARYTKELRDMLYQAEGYSDRGNWSEAANIMQAVASHASALVGTARELNLLYLLQERD